MNAQRKETTVVRPFAGLGPAERALEDLKLKVNGKSAEPGPMQLDPAEFARADLVLSLPDQKSLRDALEQAKVPVNDLALIVIASSVTNRVSQILLQEYVHRGQWERELRVVRAENSLAVSDNNGFSLTAAIVLLSDLVYEPLKPHLAGTWLARRQWRITPFSTESALQPRELTDAIRQQFQLPKNTPWFIDVAAMDVAMPGVSEIDVYVDPDLLAEISAKANSPAAQLTQIEMAIDIAATVLRQLVVDIDDVDRAKVPDLLVENRFVRGLSNALGMDPMSLLDCAKNEPHRLQSLLGAYMGVLSAHLRVVRGE